tara:strand:+ start:1227 stop:1442 length:216 start_codon:yes stop_codon:yes gene_type:complete
MDYEDKLTDEELEELLSLEEKEGDTLLSKLFFINSELVEAVLELQEFLEDSGSTREQFVEWQHKRNMRTYH